MYNPYGDEPRLNAFLLISVVLHAIIFFALPNLDSFLESDLPGMAGGGVIQVMHVETTVNPRPSPVTDRLSQTTVPKVTEPRPIPEVEPEKVAVAQPEVPKVEQPKVEQARPTVVEPPKPQVEPEPVVVEPTPEPQPEPEPIAPTAETEPIVEASEGEGKGEVITSPVGPEVSVEAKEPVTPPSQPRPEPETKPTAQSSGTGEGLEGVDDEGGISQSGTGSAPSSPPPPPPPPSGSSLHLGGGSPTYPKNAEHDGLEGRVLITLEVAAHGELQSIALIRSSGHELLDLQALRYIENLWAFKAMDYDYTMDVEVVYVREANRFTTNLNYGEVKWLNLP